MLNRELLVVIKQIGVLRYEKNYKLMICESDMISKAGYRIQEGYVVSSRHQLFIIRLKEKLDRM